MAVDGGVGIVEGQGGLRHVLGLGNGDEGYQLFDLHMRPPLLWNSMFTTSIIQGFAKKQKLNFLNRNW